MLKLKSTRGVSIFEKFHSNQPAICSKNDIHEDSFVKLGSIHCLLYSFGHWLKKFDQTPQYIDREPKNWWFVDCRYRCFFLFKRAFSGSMLVLAGLYTKYLYNVYNPVSISRCFREGNTNKKNYNLTLLNITYTCTLVL